MSVTEKLIGEYTVRRPREDELHAILEVVNECELADNGAIWLSEADLRAFGSLLDRERDQWVVADAEGRIVASAGVAVVQPVHMRGFVFVQPAHRSHGIGTALLRLVEERAVEAVPTAPPDAQVVLRQGVGPLNDAARSLLEDRGYRFVRRFWTMAMDLDEEPPPPDWPPGVSVTALGEDEERTVFEAVDEAFEDHWGNVRGDFEQWRTFTVDHENFDPTLWRLVWDGDELAAASLNAVRSDGGWVNVLGVRRPWRRRGIALALLRESFREFRRRGLSRAWLGVDSENPTGATRLYERAGMRVERSSDAYEKVLREGDEA